MMEKDSVSDSQPTRQQLYDRIMASSKKQVVLEEMQRLGFWPGHQGEPALKPGLLKREAELKQMLSELGADLANLTDPEKILNKIRKERMAQARERRALTREKKIALRQERAQVWHHRRQSEILYLGEGVSAGLNHTVSDYENLDKLALPVPRSIEELGFQMGLSLAELRFLTYERRISKCAHYRRFEIAKKTGGTRRISAPMPRLKRAQYWILDNILAKVPLHEAAYGFVPKRSIAGNAVLHVDQSVVINLDLQDFFPSILYPRIKGVFRSLGYSEQIATVLALLCSEATVEEVSADGETFFIKRGSRCLPQGAPTSPALTNILCRRMDRRLSGVAKHLGFRYSRYADDLTFSAQAEAGKKVGKLLWRVKQVIADEGFTVHPDKERVMRAHQRQQVTGLVVNHKLAIDRKTLRRFRAVIHQLEQGTPAESLHWNGNHDVLTALEGYASFIVMVDPDKGRACLGRIKALRNTTERSHLASLSKHGSSAASFRQRSAKGEAPWQGWWQPTTQSGPVSEKSSEEKRAQWKAAKKRIARQDLYGQLFYQIMIAGGLAALFKAPIIFAGALLMVLLLQAFMRGIKWPVYFIVIMVAVLMRLAFGVG